MKNAALPIVAASLALASLLSGCVVRHYPMTPTLTATQVQAMNCEQMRAGLTEGQDAERRIAEIAARGHAADGKQPHLYSTAKADADRSAGARIQAMEAAINARPCPAG